MCSSDLLPGQPQADDPFEQAAVIYRESRYREAFQLFLPLAESGDSRAQTVVALMFKYGEGVPLDLKASFNWYKQAAEGGYPPAQHALATIYRDGKGTEPDLEAARQWYERAARGGFERADHELATLSYAEEFNPASNEPTPWSKAWNLRLPNDIRFREPPPPQEKTVSYRVQLGAMGSEQAAYRLWRLVSEANPDLFNQLRPTIAVFDGTARTV